MTKEPKIYAVSCMRNGRENIYSGTMEELQRTFEYSLETGRSYQHEKGNSKIEVRPKTIKSLVSNLNKAKNNAAANGYSDTYYNQTNL